MQNHTHTHCLTADPGYYALDRSIIASKPSTLELIKVPVVGWIVRYDLNGGHAYHLEPICIEALSALYRGEVLHPDGRVIAFASQQWDCIEEFKAEVDHDWDATRDQPINKEGPKYGVAR